MIGSVVSDVIMFGSAALFLCWGISALRLAGKGQESARMRWFGIDYRFRGVSYLLLALILVGGGVESLTSGGLVGLVAFGLGVGATLVAAVIWVRWLWRFSDPVRLNALAHPPSEAHTSADDNDSVQ